MFVNRNRAGARWLVILTAVSLMPGCGAFGLRKQLQQLEHENSRLLSEFRAERQRREAAEQSAQQLEHRLAESEKLLARQSHEEVSGRLSSLPGNPFNAGFSGGFGPGSSGGTSGTVWGSTGVQNTFGGQALLDGQSGSGAGELMWKHRSN